MNGTPATPWKYAKLAYVLVGISWIVYAALSFFAPQNTSSHFVLDNTQRALLQLTIVIPILLIWSIAVRGAVAFKHYSSLINGNGLESNGISQIANGLLWTIAYLVIGAVLGAVLPFYTGASLYGPLVILRDHLTSVMSLVAFLLLYRGSHRLRDVASFATWTRATIWALAIYAIFAFLFVLEFSLSPVGTSSYGSRTSTSFVSHSILLFSLILPYLIAWFLGILASINISKFSRQVKGVIYRKALRDLVRGLWGVIAFSIMVQLLNFVARYLTALSLAPLLLIVYLLLALYGLGFLFVRAGAKKLAKIEMAQ